MWSHVKAGVLGVCCVVAFAAGSMGCHHDHDDYDGSRQSGYYQDRNGYDRHYDYGHTRSSDRDDYDHDRHTY